MKLTKAQSKILERVRTERQIWLTLKNGPTVNVLVRLGLVRIVKIPRYEGDQYPDLAVKPSLKKARKKIKISFKTQDGKRVSFSTKKKRRKKSIFDIF